jgi:hypothetical protein
VTRNLIIPVNALKKRAVVDTVNPIDNAGILKQVLSYAGAGEFIFYAPTASSG